MKLITSFVLCILIASILAGEDWSYNYVENKGQLIYSIKQSTVVYVSDNAEYIAYYHGKDRYFVFYSVQDDEFEYFSGRYTWNSDRGYDYYFGDSILYDLNEKYGEWGGSAITYQSNDNWSSDFKNKMSKLLLAVSAQYSVSSQSYTYVYSMSRVYYRVDAKQMKNILEGNQYGLGYDAYEYKSYYGGWEFAFSNLDDGVDGIEGKRIKFERRELAKRDAGWDTTTYIVTKLHDGGIDLSSQYTSYFGSQTGSWKFYARLGGGVDFGMAGYNRALYNVMRYLDDQTTKENLQNILTKYFKDKRAKKNEDYQGKTKGFAKETKDLIETYELQSSWSGLYEICNGIGSGNWTYRNVNMMSVLQIMWRPTWTESDARRIIFIVERKS